MLQCSGHKPVTRLFWRLNEDADPTLRTRRPRVRPGAGRPAGLAAPPKAAHAAPKKYVSAAPVVRMQTTKGTILIKLFPKDAPITVANFEKLVNKGFYNGLTFHRDRRPGRAGRPGQGHIVQGGDPAGQRQGGPGYTIKGEFKSNGVNNPLTHVTGAVAMARTNEPNSAGSQFYICTSPCHFLDGNYAVFGRSSRGWTSAKKLRQGDKMTKVTWPMAREYA